MQPLMPVIDANNEIVRVPLSPEVVGAAGRLVHAPHRYFDLPPGAVSIPVSDLVLSHVRLPGIEGALRKMAAAYDGSHALRAPIQVRAMKGEKFLVLDGNSTSAVAIAAGWPDLPCLLLT
ncbi:MAG: hypothetical protein JWR80_660 [Bradyrhizobium sp.]|nr:hypothetical protein [Bradyrhizobium sp.]